jgi:hypothetical protein
MQSTTTTTTVQPVKYVGIPTCTECGGTGFKTKKKTKTEGKTKPCKTCAAATGNCPLCNNTGVRVDKPGKECKCKKQKDKKEKKAQKEAIKKPAEVHK